MLILGCAAGACSGPPTATTSTAASAQPANDPATAVQVVRVTDGDTITALRDGEKVRVRLIGVNAPESGECLAEESKKRLEELLRGKTVSLETDEGKSDRFGRTPAYLWAEEVLVNEQLAAEGPCPAPTRPTPCGKRSWMKPPTPPAGRAGECGPPTPAAPRPE